MTRTAAVLLLPAASTNQDHGSLTGIAHAVWSRPTATRPQ